MTKREYFIQCTRYQFLKLIRETPSGSGSGLYSGGLTWSIVLRCDDHTGIFTCDGFLPGPVLLCARRDTELCD